MVTCFRRNLVLYAPDGRFTCDIPCLYTISLSPYQTVDATSEDGASEDEEGTQLPSRAPADREEGADRQRDVRHAVRCR